MSSATPPNEPGSAVSDEEAELAALGLTIDELDAAIEDIEMNLAEDLSVLWEVPEGFEDRVAERAWRKIQDRQSLQSFADLFGLGWQTARAIVDPVEDQE